MNAALRAVAGPLRTGGVVLLCGAAILRSLSTNLLQASFDVDPLLAGGMQPGIVPAAGLALDGVVLIAAAAILLGEAFAGRAVLLWPVLLALVPLPILFWHGMERGEHAWRGATWFAAIFGAVALAHAARDPHLRRLALAMLLAALAPMVLRGASQVLIEHPAALRQYLSIREAFLADRGWAPDSAAVRIYEERLRQPEASAWFGFANVASSFFAAGTIAFLGLLVELWRMWRRRGRPVAPLAPLGSATILPSTGAVGLIALAALGTSALLVVNGSKGALAAGAVGLALMALRPWLSSSPLPPGEGGERSSPLDGSSRTSAHDRRTRSSPGDAPRHRRHWSPTSIVPLLIAPLLILAALSAVVVRGAILPESFAHERSVLFRWHYLSDAARVLAAHPIVGVGPDGFQEAMIAVRPPRHPEEVTSAHSVFVDFIAALGPLGLAWVMLLLVILAHGGAWAARDGSVESGVSAAPRDLAGPDRRSVLLAAAGMTALLLLAVVIEAPALDPTTLALRLFGVAAGAGLLLALRSAFTCTAARWMLFAAACVIAVHGQIEMTFHLQGSAAWALLLVAAACPLPAQVPVLERRALARLGDVAVSASGASVPSPAVWRDLAPGICTSGVATALAILLLAQAVPLWRQERLMADAAEPLERFAQARAAERALVNARDAASWRAAAESVRAALADLDAPAESRASLATLLGEPDPARREVAIRTLREVLRAEEFHVRLRTIEGLNIAWSADEGNIRPLLAVIDQALRAAPLAEPGELDVLLLRTLATVNYVVAEREDSLRIRRRHAELLEVAARAEAERSGDAARSWRRAMEAWEEVVRRDPAAIPALLRLAESAEAGGRPQRAIEALEQALSVDDQLHLDPRKQLGESRREEILARLDHLRSELPG